MRSNRDDGSVLIADLALASVIVLVVAALAAAFGGVAGAMQDDREAARHAAVIVARTGDLDRATNVARRLAPGATVRIEATRDHVAAWVSGPIVVAHPTQRRITVTAQGYAEVPVAPYRSNRG